MDVPFSFSSRFLQQFTRPLGVRTRLVESSLQQEVKEALIAYFFLWQSRASLVRKPQARLRCHSDTALSVVFDLTLT